MSTSDVEYEKWIADLKTRYQSSQIKAAVKVNSELIKFYWSLGKDIVVQKAGSKWGSGFYKKLSSDLTSSIPNVKGFSETNLKHMKHFFELFKNETMIRPQLVDELTLIPWGHIRYIIDYSKSNSKKALFFIQDTLPALQGDLAQQLTKDPYTFDFITISEKYNERELKAALIDNIEKFLLELGRGFAYMGREYRLQVGAEEKYLDLLFYNVNLRCYVVIEVKVEKFDSAYLGQLGLYVSAVNHLLKNENDNPTIGLLICKSKDDVVAQYSIESSAVPISISEYELKNLYPADFKCSLPSIEEIEKELSCLE